MVENWIDFEDTNGGQPDSRIIECEYTSGANIIQI
jgi:hypothetical protein